MDQVKEFNRVYVKGDPVIIADFIAKAKIKREKKESNEGGQRNDDKSKIVCTEA